MAVYANVKGFEWTLVFCNLRASEKCVNYLNV